MSGYSWHSRIKENRLEVTSKLCFAQHTCHMALRHLRRRAINSLTTTYISTTTISSSSRSIAIALYNVRLADDERKLFFSEQNHSSSIVHNSFARWQATLVPVLSGGSNTGCLLYTSPSPRDRQKSRMPSSA